MYETMTKLPVRDVILLCLSEVMNESIEIQKRALETLCSVTKVSPPNRNLLAQTDGAINTFLTLSKSSSHSLQALSLSILFNLSLNPNLKQSLASMETITHLNSVVLSPSSPECSKLAASLVCSMAMLDKNKARFGVAGTIQVLVKVVAGPQTHATHHLLSTLAELVQFHGNCTLAVRSDAIKVLLDIVKRRDSEDLAGTSLAILGLLVRFEEGLNALRTTNQIVSIMLEVLKGRCMLSKEGASEILIQLFDDSEGCVSDAMRLPEFTSVLADISVRGSKRVREKAGLLMKKMMMANSGSFIDDNVMFM